jgi:general secretion pathway protein A
MDSVLQYFNLLEEPFSISPNPKYLYLTPQHQQVVYQCQYTIEQKNGLAIIYGDIGTGKTTIARRIFEQYADDPAYEIAMMITPDLKTDTAFLRGIMAEFGVAPKRSHAANITAFRKYAMKAYKEEKNIVLLVDEAQQMTPKMIEVIRVFLNFESNSEKFIQIILFGQNELATMIDAMKPIKSRVNVFGSLASLTDTTIMDMIAFRWKVAGGMIPHPFNLEAVQTIFTYSQGLPREIMKLCNMSLTRAFIQKTTSVHSSMVAAAAKELRMKEDA